MFTARIREIFASLQGEGPMLGERHIFVRFQGCDLHCRYCDTTEALALEGASGDCSAQHWPRADSGCELVPNPVSADHLSSLCSRLVIPYLSRPVICLTGGEPLLQHEFLAAWLPQAMGKYLIHLETNGIHAAAIGAVARMTDVVGMDFKLPSATGLRSYWEEHEAFLTACRGPRLFAKAVVTRDTSREDVLLAARIIARHDATIPFVLQPAAGELAPPVGLLLELQQEALAITADVRVIPQAHKILGVR